MKITVRYKGKSSEALDAAIESLVGGELLGSGYDFEKEVRDLQFRTRRRNAVRDLQVFCQAAASCCLHSDAGGNPLC